MDTALDIFYDKILSSLQIYIHEEDWSTAGVENGDQNISS